MKRPYDFSSPEEREWVERCRALAMVVLIVVLGMFAGLAFGADAVLDVPDGSAWAMTSALLG